MSKAQGKFDQFITPLSNRYQPSKSAVFPNTHL